MQPGLVIGTVSLARGGPRRQQPPCEISDQRRVGGRIPSLVVGRLAPSRAVQSTVDENWICRFGQANGGGCRRPWRHHPSRATVNVTAALWIYPNRSARCTDYGSAPLDPGSCDNRRLLSRMYEVAPGDAAGAQSSTSRPNESQPRPRRGTMHEPDGPVLARKSPGDTHLWQGVSCAALQCRGGARHYDLAFAAKDTNPGRNRGVPGAHFGCGMPRPSKCAPETLSGCFCQAGAVRYLEASSSRRDPMIIGKPKLRRPAPATKGLNPISASPTGRQMALASGRLSACYHILVVGRRLGRRPRRPPSGRFHTSVPRCDQSTKPPAVCRTPFPAALPAHT
jgi:hypothetical protein